MDDYSKNKLAQTLTRKDYQKGDKVIIEGEAGDTFFLVEVGKLVAYKLDSQGRRRDEMPYEVGSYFGELAILEDRPRQATVECVENCRLLEIDRESFRRMLGAETIDLLQQNKTVYCRT